MLRSDPASAWLEVGRNSSALFKADRSLHASRVYINAGDRPATRELIESAALLDGPQVAVPQQTETILVQQLIGFDDQLRPVVTPVIDDLRVRSLHGPAERSAGNRSSSRDGSNHWIYYRTRLGSLRKNVPTFRFVADSDQSLFVEYGTLKHATFAAQCALCHHGPLLSDDSFHDLGLSYYGRRFQDLGRYEVTADPADVGRFRTPSLRDISRTAPLMHNGLFQLTGVLNMYNAGMATLRRGPDQLDDPLFPTKSPHLQSLGLNRQDLDDLAAFLEALEEPPLRVRPPRLPIIPPPPSNPATAEPATAP